MFLAGVITSMKVHFWKKKVAQTYAIKSRANVLFPLEVGCSSCLLGGLEKHAVVNVKLLTYRHHRDRCVNVLSTG